MERRFSLIGPGRAGRSIAAALTELGWDYTETYRRGDDLSLAASGVELCIIATPDSEIEHVAQHVHRGEATLMHISGATPVGVLGPHNAAALHPLVSLADPDSGARALRTAWFAVAGDSIARNLAEALSGKWFEINDEDRGLYHGAAAIAANHLVALLGQVERIATEIDVPFAAFLDLVRSSVQNTADFGPRRALTGPVAREDEETIDAHRRALAERLPKELPGYEAMLAEARRLVERPAAD